jgi:hypothetical protein
MIEKWFGVYRFDPENSARLLARMLGERLPIRQGFETAVEELYSEPDPEIDSIRLQINENSLELTNNVGSECFPVSRCWKEADHHFLEVIWHGSPTPFEIQEFEEGCIRLYHPSNALSEYVWRPVTTEQVEPGGQP